MIEFTTQEIRIHLGKPCCRLNPVKTKQTELTRSLTVALVDFELCCVWQQEILALVEFLVENILLFGRKTPLISLSVCTFLSTLTHLCKLSKLPGMPAPLRE